MKKLLFILTGLFLAGAAFAVPSWFTKAERSPDGIFAVGMANAGDVSLSIDLAEAEARAALSRILSTDVDNNVYAENDNGKRNYRSTTQLKSKNRLNGSYRTKMHKASDGTVYVQMFLPFE